MNHSNCRYLCFCCMCVFLSEILVTKWAMNPNTLKLINSSGWRLCMRWKWIICPDYLRSPIKKKKKMSASRGEWIKNSCQDNWFKIADTLVSHYLRCDNRCEAACIQMTNQIGLGPIVLSRSWVWVSMFQPDLNFWRWYQFKRETNQRKSQCQVSHWALTLKLQVSATLLARWNTILPKDIPWFAVWMLVLNAISHNLCRYLRMSFPLFLWKHQPVERSVWLKNYL